MKDVSDLTEKDFLDCPAWFLPMVESDTCPDTAITPVKTKSEIVENNVPVYVRARFTAKNGNNFLGYISWVKPERIEDIQPVIFAGGRGIYTYFGSAPPEPKDLQETRIALGDGAFPIHFQSDDVFGLAPIIGSIEGLYYIVIGSGIKFLTP
jgi:hypothetical protein